MSVFFLLFVGQSSIWICVGAHLVGSACLNLGEGVERACVWERVCHARVLRVCLGVCVLWREICVKVVPTEPFCFVVSPPSLLDDQAADLNTFARKGRGMCAATHPHKHTRTQNKLFFCKCWLLLIFTTLYISSQLLSRWSSQRHPLVLAVSPPPLPLYLVGIISSSIRKHLLSSMTQRKTAQAPEIQSFRLGHSMKRKNGETSEKSLRSPGVPTGLR